MKHYHKTSDEACHNASSSTTPTFDKVARVLSPHQTNQERNISHLIKDSSLDTPIWVRTCYSLATQDQYDRLARAAHLGDSDSVERQLVLDDAHRYSTFGSLHINDFVGMLLERIPSLCDVFRGSVPEDYETLEDHGAEDGTEISALQRASAQAYMLVALVDEEAIQEHRIKLLWLDLYGNCVWQNMIDPNSFPNMKGAFLGGYTLEEAVETHCIYGNPSDQDEGEGDDHD